MSEILENKDLSYYLKSDVQFYAILIVIIVIIIIAVRYIYYMINLQSRECSNMDKLYPNIDGNLKSLNPNDPTCKNTLKDYYIKTAYNCCSGGSYKNDYVNTCNLKDVIGQGVRCLDFEIYSINDEPVVATSTDENYNIKETYNYITFADVMNVVVNYGFSNSTAPNPNDPIFFHLRIKSANDNMYQKFASLFKNYDKYFLGSKYSYENNGKNLGDVPLMSLSNKIVVIVDKINNNYMDNKNFYEYVNLTSNSIFMRALTYSDVKNTADLVELQDYNKNHMTICLPDKGANPPNPNGIVMRDMGCQFLAFRYQLSDTYLQENTLFFDKTGYGFALKPEKLRS
jgi:hypothetical protein